ncbi:Proline-specific permease ProY [Pseudomonas sp. 22 E 5]|uniref:amino acid permease n=1 Tax=Pseudomonas brassicacearum TaxID=930166 RepID=UPI000812B169|nr:amino acid permease [Pseudomonas brassicacearum]CAH0153733.1 Proline-specific permease ProY [Pseudomonas brassicacearum]CRM90908.1 Proline-specific permease ProY [Pseudomonas sp. 22 E 5]
MANKLLSSRQISFMALGMSIGVGLFLGSASAIKSAGPSVLLAYIISGGVIFLIMRALGEMTVHNPVSGSFAAYAHEYLGPYAGFLSSWNYWILMVGVGVAESTAVGIYMKAWFPDVPQWTWVCFSIASICALNLLAVRAFGEAEFWFALIKVATILALIAGGGMMIVTGWGNNGVPLGLSNLWQHGGWFPNGISGMLISLPIVAYAFAGVEMIGIAASESEDPKKTIPRAINSVLWRILLFYVAAIAVILAIYPWDQIGTQGSPFVTTFERLGIKEAAGIINFVVITAALSSFNCILFSGGRILKRLADEGQAPKMLQKVRSNGIPARAVFATVACMAFGVVLNYAVPDRAFGYMMSLLAFNVAWTWGMITLTYIFFQRRIRKSGVINDYPMPLRKISPAICLLFVAFVLFMLGYESETRVSLYAGGIWTVVISVLYFLNRQPSKVDIGGVSVP